MIVFQNQGLLDLDMLRIMGVSVKPATSAPVGYFGTGLKYAVAVLLREKCSVSIWLGREHHALDTTTVTLRVEDHQVVTLDGERLPFTLNYGRSWEPWQAFRELYSNAHDEPEASVHRVSDEAEPVLYGDDSIFRDGYTTIVVTGEAVEKAYDDRGSTILQSQPTHEFPSVHAHEGQSNFAYYQGIRVGKLQHSSILTWDLRGRQTLTEDRTLAYSWMVPAQCARAWVTSDDPVLIEKILTASESYLEGNVDYGDLDDANPSEVFYEVAERLRNDQKLGGKSKTLFAAFREQMGHYGYRDRTILDLTVLQRMHLQKAVDVLKARGVPMDNVDILFREQNGPSGYEDKITMPAEAIDMPVDTLAVNLLVGRALANGRNAGFQLSHFVVHSAFPDEEVARETDAEYVF